MSTGIIRAMLVKGVLAVIVLTPLSYGGTKGAPDNEDMNRALASAEERGRRAQMAEPAYPSQPQREPGATPLFGHIGASGASDATFRIEPVALSQTETTGTAEAAGGAQAPASGSAAGGDIKLDRLNEQETPVFSIRQDLKNAPRWLWEDTKRVYLNPLNLALLLTAGGASIAVHQHVDWTINNKFRESRTCKEAWGDTADVLGYPPLHLAIAGAWYLAGYEFKDLKTYNVGKNLLSALIITDLSTVALKACAADTERPTGDHFSWPSGHVSSTFAMAAVLDEAYGHVVGVPMYALAGWVSFERLDDRQHMFSDVIFGGMLGLVIGHSVASGHLPQIAGGTILPYSDPQEGTAGICWWKSTK
jgi:membrane-associated phospholipid phosphatase